MPASQIAGETQKETINPQERGVAINTNLPKVGVKIGTSTFAYYIGYINLSNPNDVTLDKINPNGWQFTRDNVREAAEQLFVDPRVAECVADYFFRGVCVMLGIDPKNFDPTELEKYHESLCNSGVDPTTAGQIVAALNPAYWAIQYIVNLAYMADEARKEAEYKKEKYLKVKKTNPQKAEEYKKNYERSYQNYYFIIGRIIYYFGNGKELGTDVFGNKIVDSNQKVSIGTEEVASSGKISTYFGYEGLKKAIAAVYGGARKKLTNTIETLETDREEILKGLEGIPLSKTPIPDNGEEIPPATPPPSSGKKIEVKEAASILGEGAKILTLSDEKGKRDLVLGVGGEGEKKTLDAIIFGPGYLNELNKLEEGRSSSLKNALDEGIKIGIVEKQNDEYIVDVNNLARKKENLKEKEIKEYTSEDLKVMALILAIQLEINFALEYLFEQYQKAAKDGNQAVDPNPVQMAKAGVELDLIDTSFRDAAEAAVRGANDGRIDPYDARSVMDALRKEGLTIDDALYRLREERAEIEENLKRVRNLIALLEIQERINLAMFNLQSLGSTYGTTDIKKAVETYIRKDLSLYATIVEKEEEWKKYFLGLKQAYEYAKSKEPPALKRFIRKLSETTNYLTEIARTLELMDRVCGYSLLLISISENIKNVGNFFTMTDLLNMGFGPENFSNLVKEEKGKILKLSPDVMPTLAFFGIFELKKGKLSFSHKGNEYLNAWCKENNYDFQKMKDELLVEFSNGLLSSFGQSFLAFAVRKAMEDNGISFEDKEMFNDVKIRTEAARVLLSEKVKELDKKIRGLGAKSLVVDTAYARNYLNAMNGLRNLGESPFQSV